MTDTLAKAAITHWPELAKQAGLDPSGWQSSVISRRSDARLARIVLRMTDQTGQSVVLKYLASPHAPESFGESVAAHLAAQEAFPTGVPKILAVDLQNQSYVMDFAPGVSLSDALKTSAPVAQNALLQKAGAWLASYHRATAADRRTFQPKFTLNYLRQILKEAQSGERQIADFDAFETCANHLLSNQARFENRETIAAQSHGDLHMRNLIMGTDRCLGIDFAKAPVVPVGHDIGRLLADYAILRAPHTRIDKGSVLPEFALNAFFDGYDFAPANDPSVQLIMRHRILAEWWGLPTAAERRSLAQQTRLDRIMSLAPRVFA